ncbi:amino acid adenylation domain-containing protein, partial [Tolypothrix sp. VBCCA 56010]|uniref:amino acid adenylation domain-containing protein n=1 Tax=Tolypothrix sp. VBCCA 56010 TaxID=3137731 RepID=UPI003D7D0FF6
MERQQNLEFWYSRITGSGEQGLFPEYLQRGNTRGTFKIPVPFDLSQRIRKAAQGNDDGEMLFYLVGLLFQLNGIGLVVNSLFVVPRRSGSEASPFFVSGRVDRRSSMRNFVKSLKEQVEMYLTKIDYDSQRLVDLVAFNSKTDKSSLPEVGLIFKGNDPPSRIFGFPKLLVSVGEEEGRDIVQIVYHQACFAEAFIERFATSYLLAIERILTRSESSLDDVVSNAIIDNEALSAPVTSHDNLAGLFHAVACSQGASIAVKDKTSTFSYRELDEWSWRIAWELQRRGVSAGERVGLELKRTVYEVAGILGILKAGGTYVPIDPSYPAERKEFIRRDSGVRLRLIDADQQPDDSSLVVQQCMDWQEGSYDICRGEDSIAYFIYTSGTTGYPKGVKVSDRNVLSLLFHDGIPFEFSSSDRWIQVHSVSFDFSVWEIFGSLLYGGQLYVAGDEEVRDAEKLSELIEGERITVLNQTPGMFNYLWEYIDRRGESLRYVVFGGEALQPSRLAEWHRRHRSVKLVNMYGITETTVHVSYKEIGEAEIASGSSNIGKSLRHLRLYLVDESCRAVGPGVVGEIAVGGWGVSAGYHNREELTALRFVEDPWNEGNKMYLSGDLGVRLENGDI